MPLNLKLLRHGQRYRLAGWRLPAGQWVWNRGLHGLPTQTPAHSAGSYPDLHRSRHNG